MLDQTLERQRINTSLAEPGRRRARRGVLESLDCGASDAGSWKSREPAQNRPSEVGRGGTMRRITRWVAMTGEWAMFAVACSSSGGGGRRGERFIRRRAPGVNQGGTYSFVNGEPTSMTPQNDYEAYGIQAFEVLFTRLMDFDFKTGAPVPAQAESVTPSSDGMTYTIVRDGWTFHDGEPVTAQSYVDAWNYTRHTARTASSSTSSSTRSRAMTR